eukprot:6718258-Pyramimonas_sp.AAC.1
MCRDGVSPMSGEPIFIANVVRSEWAQTVFDDVQHVGRHQAILVSSNLFDVRREALLDAARLIRSKKPLTNGVLDVSRDIWRRQKRERPRPDGEWPGASHPQMPN